MLSVLNDVAAKLLDAEPEKPESFRLLPNALRVLVGSLEASGKSDRAIMVGQRAVMLESLCDDADAIRVVLCMLGREIEAIQIESRLEEQSAAVATTPTAAIQQDDCDDEILSAFFGEATEHLDAAEPLLLQLEQRPNDTDALNKVFRHFHSVKGTARFVGLESIADVAQSGEDILDQVRSRRRVLDSHAVQMLVDCLDKVRQEISKTFPSSASNANVDVSSTARSINEPESEVAHKTSQVKPKQPARMHSPAPSPSSSFVADDSVAKITAPTTAASKAPEEPTATAKGAAPNEAVRVDRVRLDELINLVGELVICESMVQECFGMSAEGQVEHPMLHQLRSITRELQELSLGLRMVPILSLFQKSMRLVRDLGRKVNKPVDVKCVGEDTELDKTVIDQISDPLVHIIRNSMDHGIESSTEERIAAGKPERATICLKAYHQSGDICIEISDDGRGLNRARIRQKAIERGLIRPDQQLTDDEVCDLIFRPGFSTAEKVTDLSGRGVGMDVVRQNIAALRGTVQMTSIEGQGTRLLIRLPLTLGIIDGMVVRSGNERFIVPTSNIVELIQPRSVDISLIQQRGSLLNVRGQSVPFFRLDQTFDLINRHTTSSLAPTTAPATAETPLAAPSNGLVTTITKSTIEDGIVVLVDDKDRLAGLFVDQVLGRQQVVIKGLQGIQGDLKSFAGCAVMPDGMVGLILDVPATLERARQQTA